MKLNHPLAITFLTAIVASLAIALAVEHQARFKRTMEHQTLEQQLNQMAGLVALNQQLSNRLAQAIAPELLPPDQLLELLRLRGEVGVFSRQPHDLDQAREENRQVHAVLDRCLKTLTETNPIATTDYWPQGSWTNCGSGSPEAALQTLLWAGYNGDLTNFSAQIADESKDQDWAKEFKGKSEAEAAIRLADETYGLKSVQILNREAPDNRTVVFTVEMENAGGFQTVKMLMKETGGEWKFAGPQQ